MSQFETTGTIASFGGKLLKLKHKSSSTNTDMELNLFMPPQASKSGAKVPVLFYLSGLTCTGNNCSEKGFFQHGAAKHGIAVVYPDTSPSRSLTKFSSRLLTPARGIED
jgi:S-formylglutathione hydrolase